MAIVSDLAQGYVQTPNCNPRDISLIDRITIHHFGYIGDAENCAYSFLPESRKGSANYCIGLEGDIWCACAEEYRSWASGGTDSTGKYEGRDPVTGMTGRDNDFRAVTIECSNCEEGGEWAISEATWDSLVNLCVDICKRYHKRLNFTGAGDGTLTHHSIFSATTCPGPYLIERMVLLERTVNDILDEEEEVKMTREEKEMMARMECNEWLHRDPDDATLEKLCELIGDDESYEDFNTGALDKMLEDSAEYNRIHRLEAIKSMYRTCLGREASDAEAVGWESGENASLRNIYKGIYNSAEAEAYRKSKFTL